jgi:hypothetical protein
MRNRQLTSDERTAANRVLAVIRDRLKEYSGNDASLEWALRRYIYIRLQHDERGAPMKRRVLKAKLAKRQSHLCVLCSKRLPQKGAVLDRLEAMKGYTEENTRLLCPDCDRKVQEQRHYA